MFLIPKLTLCLKSIEILFWLQKSFSLKQPDKNLYFIYSWKHIGKIDYFSIKVYKRLYYTQGKKPTLFEISPEILWVEYSATKGPCGQIFNQLYIF